ncbi:MAG: tRNA 2-methylthio-N6-isopentenyl adenosine(37) hydroxylase MiaE [Bacteroidia bacterium]|nr:MAG: tRNA 2-methylthio-N6-isopentenyl adenosine(37) hydroxylase MiaE [Bacteroidia bacterium]
MFKLKLPTDPRWANLAEKNISEVLTDHAFCELKAASTATSLISKFPDKTELVQAMVELVKEEIEHFNRVHELLLNRGYELGKERKDEYVNELAQFCIKAGYSREEYLINKLLLAALIEARSCERFKILSEHFKNNDPDLSQFYHELMISEANHYTLFIGFARKYAQTIDVEKRWNEILEFEGQIIQKYGKSELIHG